MRIVEQGRLYDVENKDRKFGSAERYLLTWVSDADGDDERALLFTEKEVEDAWERAKKNPEDILKKRKQEEDKPEQGGDSTTQVSTRHWHRPLVETFLPMVVSGVLFFFIGLWTCSLGNTSPGTGRPTGGGTTAIMPCPPPEDGGAACRLQARDLALRAAQLPRGSAMAEQACRAYRAHQTCAGKVEEDQPFLYETLLRARNLLEPDQPILLDVSDCVDPGMVSSHAPVRAVVFSADGRTVAAGADDGRVLLLDVESKELQRELPIASKRIRSIAWSAKGSLAVAFDGTVRVWNEPLAQDEPNPDFEWSLDGSGSVGSLAFDPGGDLLAATTSNGRIGLFRVGSDEKPIVFRAHSAAISGVAFSNDGRLLAAGSPAGAMVWEVRALLADPASAARSANKVCTEHDVRAVAFDGASLLACGSEEGAIELWDITTTPAERTASLWGHRSRVSALAFSSVGGEARLASSSLDGSIRLWKRRQDEDDWDRLPIVLSDHESFVWTVRFSPDGSRLVSGSEDRTVRLWESRSELLAEQLCKRPGPTG